MKVVRYIALSCALTYGLARAAEPGIQTHVHAISISVARQLVWESLPTEAKQLPHVAVNGDGKRDPFYRQFWEFMVTWAGSPNGGSAIVGYYDVDPATGDVFDANSCDRKTNLELLELQRKVRRRLGLTESEYQKIRRSGPYCE